MSEIKKKAQNNAVGHGIPYIPYITSFNTVTHITYRPM